MDTDLLKTFLEVNKTRHFAQAANNLFVTSAAVSARIKLLESQLGVSLFLRQRGNIQLTNEGEKLVPHAETIINTWARSMQEVSLREHYDARVYIGATTSMWMLSLQNKLHALLSANPEVAIHAEGYSNEELIRKVEDRTLDIVFLPHPIAITGYRSRQVGELTLQLVGAKKQKTKDALQEGYIYVDWGTEFANWHAEKFGEVQPKIHVNLVTIAVELILNGGGAAYLPLSLIQNANELEKLDGSPTFRRNIFICYRESMEESNIVQYLIESLLSTAF